MNLKKKFKILHFNQFDKNFLWIFISSGAFIGFIPFCPGTLASLEAFIIFWFLKNLSWLYQLLIIFGILVLGIISADFIAKFLKIEDPEIVVIDEIAGMWIALYGKNTLLEFILAFFIFRVIDIKKPYPLKKVESLPYGWGIMLDDIIAGFFTNIFLIVIIYFSKKF